jgi:RNA-splicing ligase RtcB
MSVRIFGTHDDSTIAQIHRCVAVGGRRGVLCADGHKGYAQPIGGVVAYKVLNAHEGTIRVLHVLKPIGVAMAGREIRDPYKD